MKFEKISELTTNRLSMYLRCLDEIAATGGKTVSSGGLAERFHLNSAQIRKDLAYFGEFGVRGVGYYVDTLRDLLTKILGLNREHRLGIIGAGRLGSALAAYHGFGETSFKVSALFDTNPKKIGKKIGDVEVFDIKSFATIVKRDKIEVAVIAVPAEHAHQALELVVKSGIKAVMNFAPVALKTPSGVKLKTVDLTSKLQSLSFFLAQRNRKRTGSVKPKAKSRRK